MLEVLLESALRVTLIAAGTALALWLLRIRSAAVKHQTWTVMLVAMLLLPLWIQWGPQISLRVLPTAPGPVSPVTYIEENASTSTTIAPTVRGGAPANAGDSGSASAAVKGSVLGWQAMLLALYTGGAGLLLARLAIGMLRVRALLRDARVEDGWLTSRRTTTPITVGCLRPAVLLPRGWQTGSAARRAAVLEHELAHVGRRDPLWQWLALLNRAIFWFHPLAWWLERRLADLAEESCDAVVIAHGHEPLAYADSLLALARATRHRSSLAGANAMPGSSLPARIAKIVDGSAASSASRAGALGAAASCLLLSIPLATVTLAQQDVSPEQPSSRTPLAEYWTDGDEWRLEVGSIMTPEETEEYYELRTVEERARFIESFWARRDPTPGTPVNEFRDEFEGRVEYARRHLPDAHPGIPGYQSARGRVYVLLGPPYTVEADEHYETWHYRDAGSGEEFIIRIQVGMASAPAVVPPWMCPYEIVSPLPRETFEGLEQAGVGTAPRIVVQTYPHGFVRFSIPADPGNPARVAWQIRRPGETVAGFRSAGFADSAIECTQLVRAPGTYELSVDLELSTGQHVSDRVAFDVPGQ
jgi:GWxTD domain-containing protein